MILALSLACEVGVKFLRLKAVGFNNFKVLMFYWLAQEGDL